MSILKEIPRLLYKIKKSKNIVNSKFTISVTCFLETQGQKIFACIINQTQPDKIP